MGSSQFADLFDFVTDWTGAAGDFFSALSFFAGSLETVGGIVGATQQA